MLVQLIFALLALSTADFCADLETTWDAIQAAQPDNVIGELKPIPPTVPANVDQYIQWLKDYYQFTANATQVAEIEAVIATRWDTLKAAVQAYTNLQLTAAKVCLQLKVASWTTAYDNAVATFQTVAQAAVTAIEQTKTNIDTLTNQIESALGDCRELDAFEDQVNIVSERITQRVLDLASYFQYALKEYYSDVLDTANAVGNFLDDPTNATLAEAVRASLVVLVEDRHEYLRLVNLTQQFVNAVQNEVDALKAKRPLLDQNFLDKLNRLKADFPDNSTVNLPEALKEKIGQLFAEQSVGFQVDPSSITVTLTESSLFPGKSFTIDWNVVIGGTDDDQTKKDKFLSRLRRLLIVEYGFHCTETKTSVPKVIPVKRQSALVVSLGVADQSSAVGLFATLLVSVVALFLHF